jgi:hypothetical protein
VRDANNASLTLIHVGGGANQGYEIVNLSSTGAVPNVFTLATQNTDTLNINGDADLTLSGTVLNVGTLNEVDATGLLADFTATFTGTGNVVVDGAQGDDTLTFNTTGTVEVHGNDGDDTLTFGAGVVATATGGAGNDTFVFQQEPGSLVSSFTAADSVDGGTGDDTLVLFQSAGGNFFNAGVGPNIVNISTIIHRGGDLAVSGTPPFVIDWAQSGSANILRLENTYDLNMVTTINNLNNDDFVVLAGTIWQGAQGTINLNYQNAGALNIINFEMAGGQQLGVLTTQAGTEVLNLASTGANPNQIANASGINGNIVVTGGTNLTIGSLANAYDEAGGVIDAQAMTGNLTAFVGVGAQTIIGGQGNDTIWLTVSVVTTDLIDLTAGGNDTVVFADTFANAGLTPTAANYHSVVGFAVANDVIAVDVPTVPLDTTTNIAVTDTTTPLIFNYTSGTDVSATGAAYNFIKFVTPVNTAGLTVQQAFTQAMGGGSIGVTGGTNEVLAAMYDDTNSQMILFTVDASSGGAVTLISALDDVDVVGLVGMSQADYNLFGVNNLDFV